MNQIIIPSYIDHLSQLYLFFKSLDINCLDKENVNINVIVSENEKETFSKSLSEFKSLNYNIFGFKDVLLDQNYQENEQNFLNKVGKFNFQCCKKFYGIKYLGYENTLIMDSESILVRKTKIEDIFNNNKNRIFYYPKQIRDFQEIVARQCYKILGLEYQNIWFLEYQNWFIDKSTLNQMFDRIKKINNKSLFDILLKNHGPIFEIVLYNIFAAIVCKQPTINTKEALNLYLENLFDKFAYEALRYDLTPLEFACWCLNKDSLNKLSIMFNKEDLNFFKVDTNMEHNGDIQVEFVKQTESVKFICCNHSDLKLEDFQ